MAKLELGTLESWLWDSANLLRINIAVNHRVLSIGCTKFSFHYLPIILQLHLLNLTQLPSKEFAAK